MALQHSWYTLDLSQELKGRRWQLVKGEWEGGQVQAAAVSGI